MQFKEEYLKYIRDWGTLEAQYDADGVTQALSYKRGLFIT